MFSFINCRQEVAAITHLPVVMLKLMNSTGEAVREGRPAMVRGRHMRPVGRASPIVLKT
jgi:hypothetical protein